MWREAYGNAAAIQLLLRSYERPQNVILVNRLHPKHEAFQSLIHESCTYKKIGSFGYALSLRNLEGIINLETWHGEGVFSYQSASSQAVLHHLGITRWIGPVWDMCAGFGGKSALLREAGVDVVISSDISWQRLSKLNADFDRRHLQKPQCLLCDVTKPPLRSFSGHLLLDVPCSGLGVLARRPDLKLRRQTRRSIRNFPQTQSALLESAFSYLQVHSQLGYITCTLNPEENEEQIARFLKMHPQMRLLAEWQTPYSEKDDGMYGALLQRIF